MFPKGILKRPKGVQGPIFFGVNFGVKGFFGAWHQKNPQKWPKPRLHQASESNLNPAAPYDVVVREIAARDKGVAPLLEGVHLCTCVCVHAGRAMHMVCLFLPCLPAAVLHLFSSSDPKAAFLDGPGCGPAPFPSASAAAIMFEQAEAVRCPGLQIEVLDEVDRGCAEKRPALCGFVQNSKSDTVPCHAMYCMAWWDKAWHHMT